MDQDPGKKVRGFQNHISNVIGHPSFLPLCLGEIQENNLPVNIPPPLQLTLFWLMDNLILEEKNLLYRSRNKNMVNLMELNRLCLFTPPRPFMSSVLWKCLTIIFSYTFPKQ